MESRRLTRNSARMILSRHPRHSSDSSAPLLRRWPIGSATRIPTCREPGVELRLGAALVECSTLIWRTVQ
eukprot:3144247-Alexandrium_andersonii.AAC.1